MSSSILSFFVTANPPKRLDKALSRDAPVSASLSRSRLRKLIEQGVVWVDGSVATHIDASVSEGQLVEIMVPEIKDIDNFPENIPLNIVYEDDYLIVVNKPVGMVVHPAPGSPNRTLVNALLHHCGATLSGVGGSKRPGIVHRIDKDTSGLVVIAKNDFTHKHLSDQFASHSIERVYIAVCWNKISPANGKIKSLISRSNRNRTKMMSSVSRGKVAITHYKTLENLKNKKNQIVATVLECRLETGRTHQIRVHLTEKGNPLIGDRTYGRSPQSKRKSLSESTVQSIKMLPGQALHAQSLGFLHPKKEKMLHFQSVIPDYLSNLVNSIKS